jgi:hypothetical protein
MQMVRQNADGDRLERTFLLNCAIDVPQQVDMPYEQIARAIGERYGEKVCAACNARTPVPSHA